jgi:hypothetical protein
MHKINSTSAGGSRNIGINAVTPAVAPRRPRTTQLLRTIYLSARRWMAGRRTNIQTIAVQRGDYSIIS